jgi:hypothetical protein
MYVVIQTEDATQKAITNSFVTIEELYAWVEKQLAPEKRLTSVLETILKPEIYNSISISPNNNTEVKEVKTELIEAPNDVKTTSAPSIKNTLDISLQSIITEPKPNNYGNAQSYRMDDVYSHLNNSVSIPTFLADDDPHFGMNMSSWVTDRQLLLGIDQISRDSDKADVALKALQRKFIDTYCRPNCMNTYFLDENNHVNHVSSDSIHKFVWVLSLNFPSIFFKNDQVIEEHIEFLKTYNTEYVQNNLTKLYSKWLPSNPDNVYIGLNVQKCKYIISFLHRLNKIYVSDSRNASEIFLFKTFFHYYSDNKSVSENLATLWVDLFIKSKTTKSADSSIQSSELLGMFRSFMTELLKGDKEYEELCELFEDLDDYFNSKTFAKTLKNLNITDTVRKSAGIFYNGIKAEAADVTKKQINEIQPWINSQFWNTSHLGLMERTDDCQYAKWECSN